jgi:hypothetical protein
MKRQLRKRPVRLAIALVAVGAIASGAYAFMASNTVPTSYAGDGQGTISGFVVSSVHYALDTDPTKMDSVAFTLDHPAGDVRVSLDHGTSWTTCSVSGGTGVTCTFGSPEAVLPADQLRVVAVS